MKASSNIGDVLRAAKETLRAHSIHENGATFLLMDLFDISRTDIMIGTKELTSQELSLYNDGITQLAAGAPLAHITGFQEFYGRRFDVNEDVLTPRPETEELVLKVLNTKSSGILADIGTGSGAIAITLALEGDYTLYATDISEKALNIARENADKHQADIHFLHGHLLEPLIEKNIKLDILVSNPPYIAQSERPLISSGVLNYDPDLALFAEDDGLALYKEMIDALPRVMRCGGYVFFEIGHAQGAQLTKYIHDLYNITATVEQDINRLDRILWFHWCE